MMFKKSSNDDNKVKSFSDIRDQGLENAKINRETHNNIVSLLFNIKENGIRKNKFRKQRKQK